MKTAAIFLGLVLSSSALATDLDNIVKNVQAICLSPSQQGKYWNVTTTGKVGANAIIRLIDVGANAEATFTKGEWEGVQQVLKEQQSLENKNYRDCVSKLTPLFIEKFSTSALSPHDDGITHNNTSGNESPIIDRTRDVTINYGK